MRIPFDIKYRDKIESGEYKVETRDGKPVRIICWDMDSYNHIVALVANYPNYNGSLSEHIFSYGMDGRYSATAENAEDLFIVTPEPEMSEFENGMLRYLQDAANKKDDSEIVESTKEHSIKLLSLARNEFNKQIENDYREIIHGAYKRGKTDAEQEVERRIQSGELLTQEHHEKLMETQYKKTLDGVKKNWHDYFTPQAVTDIYNAGRNDVLKDLPRWRIWENGACGNSEGHPIALVHNVCGFHLVSTLGAGGERYIMLSDLEKLPGFKDEDYE